MREYEQLMERIAQVLPGLSAAKARVGQYIADNPSQVAFMSVSDVAKKTGTSESVVVRLATDLGYKGFPDLRSALRAYVQGQLTTIDLLERSTADRESMLAEATYSALRVIEDTANLNPEGLLREVARLVVGARKICVVSVRAPRAAALHLGSSLNQVLGNTQVLTDPAEWWVDLKTYTPDDLAIVISLARYRRETLQAASFLASRGVPVVAITDSIMAPVTRSAKLVLRVSTESVWFGRSVLGAVFLVEVLLALVGATAKERCTAGLVEFEQIMASRGLIHSEGD